MQTQSRGTVMVGALDRLLEAHVQHELASWRGDALATTLEASVHGLFRWFSEVTVDDVLTRDQIAEVIERDVIELRVSGGITELSGEVSRLVLTSHATSQTRLDSILTPQMYDAFADKLLALEAARRELIALSAQSSTIRSTSARLISRVMLDLIGLVLPLPTGLTPSTLSSLSAKADAVALRTLERLVEHALARLRERHVQSGEGRMVELFDPERLRSVLDDFWDRLSSMRLAELFALVREHDVEDFVVLVYEFWLRYRKTDFFRSISREVIDHFFRKYGAATVAAVIDDMGVSERMVTGEVLALVRPMLDQAARSGVLERSIRRRLEAFYCSSAARAALDG